jgi:dolichol-phosphate mannosyltransferase
MNTKPSSQSYPKLCLIVPCYNEEDALPAFFESVLHRMEAATSGAWQILCVDDGSSDRTSEVITREHLLDPRVVGIRLSRNFGHQAAVSTGLAFAKGEYIGVTDCDLQDPIEVLIQLYEASRQEQLDVCYGVRGRRDAPLFLRFAYSAFYRLIARFASYHWPEDAGDFCVMSARCHAVLVSLPEHSRMIRGLRAWVGFKQAGIRYDRPARLHGKSKYSLGRLCALALQGLVASSSIPLRLATIMGLGMSAFSGLFGLIVVINRLIPRFTILGYWVGANPGVTTLLVFLAFVVGALFLCLGIIGEYLIVMFQEVKARPTAVVEAILGNVQKNSTAVHVNDIGTVVREIGKYEAVSGS